MENRGLPRSFRFTSTEDELLKRLTQFHGAKSESQYVRQLLLSQAALYFGENHEEGQKAFQYVPRLNTWEPMETLVKAHALAERAAGGEVPDWVDKLLGNSADMTGNAGPAVCCDQPIPITAGAHFVCGRCEQELPIAGTIALLSWKTKALERSNKAFSEYLRHLVQTLKRLEQLEAGNKELRKARTSLSRAYEGNLIDLVDGVSSAPKEDALNPKKLDADKHKNIWLVLRAIKPAGKATLSEIAQKTGQDEVQVEAALDMAHDDGWVTEENGTWHITLQGYFYLQCTTADNESYRDWATAGLAWERIVDFLDGVDAASIEAIASESDQNEDLVEGVLEFAAQTKWIERVDGAWRLAKWLLPLTPDVKKQLQSNFCRVQETWSRNGDSEMFTQLRRIDAIAKEKEVVGPDPIISSMHAEPKEQQKKEENVEEVVGPVPMPSSKRKGKRKKRIGGDVVSIKKTTTAVNVVLRCRNKGVRKSLIHIVARCNPTSSQYHSVCGELLEPMSFPTKKGVQCTACEAMKDSRPAMVESELPQIQDWVRVYDGTHDLAHTRRKNKFWGSDNVACCNVVIEDAALGGKQNKWKLAPDTVRDCPKCATLRDKPNSLGARKAVAA